FFALVAILIAALGLFGLSSYTTLQRTKEIGIRKVNGAHKWQIVMLLGKQLMLWVAIAVIIAIPVTWYISKLWLQNFASRTSFSWWIVLLGGLIILLSAMITTASMTLRASSRNPVETLRYE
ncbi:MAG: FtsX-like permease family protein, partial [bacterium]|nr:FtsX-like permease family protein [bacterium]